MSRKVDIMNRPQYHTHTARCLEKGCPFYVDVSDYSQGTDFYKGSGEQYANSEFAAHQILHPDHLSMKYDDSQFCSEDEEYVEPYVRDGTWVFGYCRKRRK